MYHKTFNSDLIETKFTFFTGKGGVGKTSIACATAINLAKKGHKVLLISTDPASNLQDVFGIELSKEPTESELVDNLFLINLNPEEAAKEYRDSVIQPYIGKLPDSAIKNIEEQLSGSCTTEIAAFNEFTDLLTNQRLIDMYDYILFDTAPTGHTLRMLQLPSAWNSFIEDSTHGASCLGQLSGLEDDKEKYDTSVKVLCDENLTSLILVTRPDLTPILEAERASKELMDIGIKAQKLVYNGVMNSEGDDALSKAIKRKQLDGFKSVSPYLKSLDSYSVSLKPLSVYNVEELSKLFNDETYRFEKGTKESLVSKELLDYIDYIDHSNLKIVFTMGKGGVGKTTIASAIAKELAHRGNKVVLTTTDPANHLKYSIGTHDNLEIIEIDEEKVLEKYKNEVLSAAKETMKSDDLDYIEEDLRSPCTQEIAVFKEFAQIVDLSDDKIVIIDTAPTGHTLLLLESTESYNREVKNIKDKNDNVIAKLLPKLKDKEHTEVAIITLAEATPYYEAKRLEEDLLRAGISTNWWIINSTIVNYKNLSSFFNAKRNNELTWIKKIKDAEQREVATINWSRKSITDENLGGLLKNEI